MHSAITFTSLVAAAVTAVPIVINTTLINQYPICLDMVFPLAVSTSALVDPTTPFQISFPINQTFNINARYCQPLIHVKGSSDVLQILVHGITYNRNYWSGLQFPGFHGANYSWINYAAAAGYPTLSIDRLGHGLSDHPDPISVNQCQPQIDLMHSLVNSIKSGSVLPRKYKKTVYIGHSQGSLIGKGFIDQYPSDVDVAMLTGWSTFQPNSSLVLPGLAVAPTLKAQFSSFAHGYVTGVNVQSRANFYSTPGLDYDPDILPYDFDTEDLYAIGTALTTPNQTASSNFTGPVFLMNGQLDRIFCGPTGDCGTGNTSVLAKSKRYFPMASAFDYHLAPNTGHDLNFHYTQKQSFAAAHKWLAQVGFGPRHILGR